MNLRDIRQGIATVLGQLEGCRVYASLPDNLTASVHTALVIGPGEPYVTYSEAAGLTSRNDVRMKLIVVPPQQQGAARILDEIDSLLSCGTTEPRSIRSLLGDHISAAGTACSVSVQSASIQTITVNELNMVVAEIDLKILARC